VPVVPDARLREYDVGVLTGLVAADVERLHPDIWHALRSSPIWPAIPGEEGEQAFAARVVSVLDDIRTVPDHERAVALVSHGRTLSRILAHLLEIDPNRRTPFVFGNTSLSVVELRPHRTLLICLNDLCHLRDGLG
jgi:broad specificity phosphatase PhoE